MTVAEGTEILLFDAGRRPRSWTDAMGADQYAVLLTDVPTSRPCSANGVPQDAATATCTVFDSLDAAEGFAQERARILASVRCEVFDAEGRAHSPLLVITRAGTETPVQASQRRRLVALALVIVSLPLLWIDWRNDFGIVVPTVVAVTGLAAAVRLVHWDLGVRGLERERQQRLDGHRRRARSKD